jgi:ribosomal protein S19E (S16A)
MPRPSAQPASAPLSAPQEVTLRRVAFGQSEVRVMRSHDLAELKRQGLIEESKDGPVLTRAGRKRFDALPKSSMQTESRSFEDMMVQLTTAIGSTKR